MDGSKSKLGALLLGLVMFLAATTGYALSCVDANRERVSYEVAEVRIDGVVSDSNEFGDIVTAHGDYDDGITLDVSNETWASQLSFAGGAQ